MGRSLPRAIAAAKSAGVAAGNRAPPFESQTTGGGGRGGSVGDNNRGNGGSSNTKTNKTTYATTGKTEGGVSTEDMIAGNPRRAMEELSLRVKLEVVRREVDATLKMHATMASGERTSWLKQIERQNEENAYEVGTHIIRRRTTYSTYFYMNSRNMHTMYVLVMCVSSAPFVGCFGLVPLRMGDLLIRFRSVNTSCIESLQGIATRKTCAFDSDT